MRSINELLRRGARLRQPAPSRIKLTTYAPGLVEAVERPRMAPREEAEQAEAMSVALAQPHRRGREYNPMAIDWSLTALGRFCEARWEHEATRKDRYDAGERYANLVDGELIAMGLPGRDSRAPSVLGLPKKKTDEQILDEARIKRKNAEWAMCGTKQLRSFEPTIQAVKALAFYDRDIPVSLWRVGMDGLYNLTIHFGMEKPGFHPAKENT